MTRLPSEIPGGGTLRDQYGRREMVYKALNAALAVDDVQAAGGVFDADGREQVVINGITLSSGGLPGGWVSVKDAPYNAVGNNVADDSAAIQAAINDAKSAAVPTISVVYFPPGTYKVGTTLHADNATSAFALIGPEQGAQYQSSAAKLNYVGANNTLSTGGLLTFNSSSGWKLANLGLEYDSTAGFTGHLVQVDGGTGGGDSQDFHITHCTTRARVSNTAESAIRLHKAVIGGIDHCHITGANYGVQYSDTASTSYVVSVVQELNTFNFIRTANIGLFSGDGEMLTFRDLVHEAGTNTTAFKGSASTRLYLCVIEGGWYGDAGATTIWIDGLVAQSNQYQIVIRNNMFFSGGTVNDVAIKTGAVDASNNCGPYFVQSNCMLGSGNMFDTYTPSGTSYGQVVEVANSYVSLTNIWKGGGNGMTIRRFGCKGVSDITQQHIRSVRVASNFSPNGVGLGDEDYMVGIARGGGGVTVDIPTNATSAFPIGGEIIVFNEGSASVGTVTVTLAGGVTYYGPATVPARGNGMLRLVKVATDTWFGQ